MSRENGTTTTTNNNNNTQLPSSSNNAVPAPHRDSARRAAGDRGTAGGVGAALLLLHVKRLLGEFTSLYEDRLRYIEEYTGDGEDTTLMLRMKVGVLQSYVNDLAEQNQVLVHTIEDVEKETQTKVSRLEMKISCSGDTIDDLSHQRETLEWCAGALRSDNTRLRSDVDALSLLLRQVTHTLSLDALGVESEDTGVERRSRTQASHIPVQLKTELEELLNQLNNKELINLSVKKQVNKRGPEEEAGGGQTIRKQAENLVILNAQDCDNHMSPRMIACTEDTPCPPPRPNAAPPKGELPLGSRHGSTASLKAPAVLHDDRLKGSLQLGIAHFVKPLAQSGERAILPVDFKQETLFFPAKGSPSTPAHNYGDFTFHAFAPLVFRRLRRFLDVDPEEYRASLCHDLSPLPKSSNNCGNSSAGMLFVSGNDRFALKVLHSQQVDVLHRLLLAYYHNLYHGDYQRLKQNDKQPRLATLLPHLYGLYSVESKDGLPLTHILVTNVLVPCDILLHRRYHLKGSTYRRRAQETMSPLAAGGISALPTLKDQDFLRDFNLQLEAEHYEAIRHTIENDCRVLQSEGIINYRLVVSVHNVDQASRERPPSSSSNSSEEQELLCGKRLERGSRRGIPALAGGDGKGDRLLLFVGMEGILQRYTLARQAERAWKSWWTGDGSSISVQRPREYAQRFQRFMCNVVFIKPEKPTPLSPLATVVKQPPLASYPEPSVSTLSSASTSAASSHNGKNKQNKKNNKPSAPPVSPPVPPINQLACCRNRKDGLDCMQLHIQKYQQQIWSSEEGAESPDPCPTFT